MSLFDDVIERDIVFEVMEALFSDAGKVKELTDSLVKHWTKALEGYSDDQINYGYQQLTETKDGTWQPNIAQFLAAMTTLPGCTSVDQEAQEYWRKIEDLTRLRGAYTSLYLQNPVVAEAVRRLGGWIRLCQNHTPDQSTWIGKEFVQFYCTFKARDEDYDPFLPGILDSDNEPYLLAGNHKRHFEWIGEFTDDDKLKLTSQLNQELLQYRKVAGLLVQ